MARKCKQCKAEIPTVKACEDFIGKKGYCSIECMGKHGLAKAKEASVKRERKEHKARKEKLKTRSDYAKEAQAEFNRFIRLRDNNLLCISCGNKPNMGAYVGGGGVHAGHYRSVGACPELRYEPLNVNVQCVHCNVHKSGSAIDYRLGLIKKIGLEKVEWLEGPHEAKKYTIEELKAIKLEYRAKANELKKKLDLIGQ